MSQEILDRISAFVAARAPKVSMPAPLPPRQLAAGVMEAVVPVAEPVTVPTVECHCERVERQKKSGETWTIFKARLVNRTVPDPATVQRVALDKNHMDRSPAVMEPEAFIEVLYPPHRWPCRVDYFDARAELRTRKRIVRVDDVDTVVEELQRLVDTNRVTGFECANQVELDAKIDELLQHKHALARLAGPVI